MKAAFKIVGLLTMLWVTPMAYGQTIIKHFTVEDGLPSNEVYFVHQDTYGYFWFCTDRGISRYNGYTFTNFSTADGLTNNTVFKVFEDDKSNLWFTTFDGSITIFNRKLNRFVPYEHNDWIKSNYESGKWVHYIGFKKETQEVFFVMLLNISQFDILGINAYGNKRKLDKNSIFLDPRFADNIFVLDTTKIKNERHLIIINRGKPKNFLKVSQSIINTEDQFDCIPSYTCIDSVVYVCRFDGIYRINEQLSYENVFLNIRATDVIKDRDGFFWMTSQNNGVYIASMSQFSTLDNSFSLADNEKLKIAKPLAHRMVFYSDMGQIIITDSLGNLEYIRESNKRLTGSRVNSYYNWDSTAILFTDSYLEFKHNKFIFHNTAYNENVYQSKSYKDKSLAPVPKSEILTDNYLKNNYGIYAKPVYDFLYLNKKVEEHRMGVTLGFMNDYYLTKAYLIMISNRGLYKIYSDTTKSKFINLGLTKDDLGINEMDVVGDFMFLSTKGFGLQVVLGEKIIASLTASTGLPSDFVNSTYIDKNSSTIWCGTNNGLCMIRYTIQNNQISLKVVGVINKLDGLTSDYINSINATDSKVFVVSDGGVTIIPKNYQIAKQKPPYLNVLGYYVGETSYTGDGLQFEHTQNNFKFQYEAVTHRKAPQMYRCRVFAGNDTTSWNLTDDINYSVYNLAPGHYSFQVCARGANSDWGKPRTISFTITPQFIERWWVRGLLLLVISVFGYAFIKRRDRRLKKESELAMSYKQLELQNAKLESSTLRGQMNPHLVFNVLNSIQKLILKEEKENANKLLTRFSKLIRSALQYSRFEFIPIEDEIEFLDNYINIEQQRFPERFSYSITVDDELLQSDIKIPPLIIQPICENAIKHAFIKNGGSLNVAVKIKDDSLLEVTVSDDGIGILNNVERKESSLGIRIIKDRIKLFNESGYLAGFELYFMDEENKKGTKVVLHIPYQ